MSPARYRFAAGSTLTSNLRLAVVLHSEGPVEALIVDSCNQRIGAEGRLGGNVELACGGAHVVGLQRLFIQCDAAWIAKAYFEFPAGNGDIAVASRLPQDELEVRGLSRAIGRPIGLAVCHEATVRISCFRLHAYHVFATADEHEALSWLDVQERNAVGACLARPEDGSSLRINSDFRAWDDMPGTRIGHPREQPVGGAPRFDGETRDVYDATC